MGRLTEIAPPAALIERAAAADEAAQAELYAAVAPAVFAFLRRLAGSRALADDLFQETLIAMFENLHRFRGEAPFGAWVRQIAVSKCLMYLRSPWHRLRMQIDPPEPAHLPADRGADQLDLERALAALTPTARAIVLLYEVEGYTHEEIARMFRQSVSFSKSQLARAHRRLRSMLEPTGTPPPCTTLGGRA